MSLKHQYQKLTQVKSLVQTVENRQGLKIACLEEIALNNKWLSVDQVLDQAKQIEKTGYGQYLIKLAQDL